MARLRGPGACLSAFPFFVRNLGTPSDALSKTCERILGTGRGSGIGIPITTFLLNGHLSWSTMRVRQHFQGAFVAEKRIGSGRIAHSHPQRGTSLAGLQRPPAPLHGRRSCTSCASPAQHQPDVDMPHADGSPGTHQAGRQQGSVSRPPAVRSKPTATVEAEVWESIIKPACLVVSSAHILATAVLLTGGDANRVPDHACMPPWAQQAFLHHAPPVVSPPALPSTHAPYLFSSHTHTPTPLPPAIP